MTGLIGVACAIMAMVFFAADPMDFEPDPALQGLVWLGFAIWCFATAWQQRNWRPPTDEG